MSAEEQSTVVEVLVERYRRTEEAEGLDRHHF
jgi:hypothetical protein